MGKPIISWSGLVNGGFPSNQNDYQYNKLPVTGNLTHLGTKLVGSSESSIGLDLGSMTNLQEGDEYGIIITHSASEPITNTQFYFATTQNIRTGATGFANEDDPTYPTSGKSGAMKDYEELVAWGDGRIRAIDTTPSVDNTVLKNGLRMRLWHDLTPTPMSTKVLDTLENSKMLSNTGKFSGDISTAGNSVAGKESWIEPFKDFVSNDAAGIKLSLKIPDVEQAGVRQVGLVLRITYTY